eukprot:gene13597-18251_t
MTEQLNYVGKWCRLIETPGRMVTENLYLVQPYLIDNIYSHVFILFDDIVLIGKNKFNLNKLLRIMEHEKLSVVSPMISGANKGGGQKFRLIMQAKAYPHTDGYISTFVEMFAWVMTISAYTSLWELLCPHVNPYGWGFDFWYNGYAMINNPNHKMGIVSTIYTKHEQGDELGRTDNTDINKKWDSVLKQEKHFRMYKNIDLTKIRKGLDLSNSSWNGATKGIIYQDQRYIAEDRKYYDGLDLTGYGISFYQSKKIGRKSKTTSGD